jgi:hypothetical protein
MEYIMNENIKIKTVTDYAMVFEEEPHCRDCKYCSPNYASMAPTSHICENNEVENVLIFAENEPCEKWEYRKGKSAPSSEDVFYSVHPEYRNLSEDDEWNDEDGELDDDDDEDDEYFDDEED